MAIILPLYLCFGKDGWHSVCQPFLDTTVTFRAWIWLLEWLSYRGFPPTWHIPFAEIKGRDKSPFFRRIIHFFTFLYSVGVKEYILLNVLQK